MQMRQNSALRAASLESCLQCRYKQCRKIVRLQAVNTAENLTLAKVAMLC